MFVIVRRFAVAFGIFLSLFVINLAASSSAFAGDSGRLTFRGQIVDPARCSAVLQTSQSTPRAAAVCPSGNGKQMRSTSVNLNSGSASSDLVQISMQQINQSKNMRAYNMILSYR